MAKKSSKQSLIEKSNSTMIATVGIAAFLVVFSIVASRALFLKMNFQNRLIGEKETAVDQLDENISTVPELQKSYSAFVDQPENVIGGVSSSTGERDGDNAKLTLDSLPSKYDFPALATSLEKILKTNNYQINSISGTDEEATFSKGPNDGAIDTVDENTVISPVEMAFEISATSNFNKTIQLFRIFELSIRPIKVSTVEISGTNSDMEVIVSGNTNYQEEKKVEIKTKVVE